jgi:5-methylcytosine-specific restriction endonuclease McrA
MSIDRWKSVPPVRQDRYGYYLCRLCQQPCPEHQRYWCSEACLQRYLLTSQGTFVRAHLLERDGGICALCGVDADRMDAALEALQRDLLHPMLMSIHPMIVQSFRAEGWTNIKTRGRGSYPDAIAFTSCWEAHHVTSVIEGGGECGLENYKTLCFVCHKKVSAQQARARAEARQLSKRVEKDTKRAEKKKGGPTLSLPADDVIPF